ncbi:unnamed protein product [Sphenostylis stenocarpa]|uniref:Generative cell specific-1/HAP2 domain-containing protein n=1 Tax=Sphenostylis stenocarpa TaxID=92480 RepID=A0AA86VBE8_9FABA|nr:unnamed protein product [Sphenostylis stenocarpa]
MALRSPISITLIIFILSCFLALRVSAIQIISKSKLEKCEKNSNSDNVNCTTKIIVNRAVSSGSVNYKARYTVCTRFCFLMFFCDCAEWRRGVYCSRIGGSGGKFNQENADIADSTSDNGQQNFCICVQDVPYKPEEYYVETRKCEPDDGANVVKICERQAILRDEEGHIIENTQEVVVAPENRTVISDDKFLRVYLIGDFVGYTNIPSFEDFYLVVPRKGNPGQPQDLGRNISMWMLLERADLNRISRNQVPLYGLEGRFERINQHPSAGSYSFSIGITEVLNTNLVLELSANDFNCSKDITLMEEQFLIMKPNEITDSDYNEVDRAECQFATTATVLDNGTQGMPFKPPETSLNGFFDSIESIWNKLWTSLTEFITGKTLLVLLWLLHQKGLFDPLYDWWDDLVEADEQIVMDKCKITIDNGHHHIYDNKHHKQEFRQPNYSAQHRRRTKMHKHSGSNPDYFDDLEHARKEMHKHGHKKKNMDNLQHIADHPAHHTQRKKWDSSKGQHKETKLKHDKVRQENHGKHKQVLLDEPEDE